MSSSTKSESKEMERKYNSEGAMPNTSSAMKNNSKGAKKLTVLIMNASGPNHGEEPTSRRKQAIQYVINSLNPDLVLFQEFSWKGIHGKTWPADPVPEHFQLTTNDDASILYNINELTVVEKPINDLQRILQELQRPTKHRTPIPLDFAPIPRMCLRVVKTKGVPIMEFICISWHGKHTCMSNDSKVTEFTHLMIYLHEIKMKYNLPILIAGDFNVEMKLIQALVKEPFKLYEYEASLRRKKKGMIDYFIATAELRLSDMKPVDVKVSKAYKPEDVLDHDPIIATLELTHPFDNVPVLNQAFNRMSLKEVDIYKNSEEVKPEDVLDHNPFKAMLKPNRHNAYLLLIFVFVSMVTMWVSHFIEDFSRIIYSFYKCSSFKGSLSQKLNPFHVA